MRLVRLFLKNTKIDDMRLLVLLVLVGGLEYTRFIVSHSAMRYAPRHAACAYPVVGMTRPYSARGMNCSLWSACASV
jgi:hypothetical protein